MRHFPGNDLSRRGFVSAAAGMVAVAGKAQGQKKARYTRYNVTSAKGQDMLKSYAVAVGKLMALPANDPRNWFRNSFIHALDCPHGNWWFFVWHRGWLGWFEQTLRQFSGNPDFAIPYWDWTELPKIPPGMFDGVLDPSNPPFDPVLKDFPTYFNYLNPALTTYWNGLSQAQLNQLQTRMIPSLASLWSQVQGNATDGSMFTTTPYARYITAASPDLDVSTKKMVAPNMVLSGLAPTQFSKFNSGQTPSHNTQPGGTSVFAILEGNPHNSVHNNIGGVGHVQNPLNFGFMADNLSPTDPIFFLHHSNMDRLWDVWTRKQQALGLPFLPAGRTFATFAREPFLFYIDSQGNPVQQTTAGDYVNIGMFDYDYEPGFGETVIGQPRLVASAAATARFSGRMTAGSGAVTVPAAALTQNATDQNSEPLVVQVTLPRPTSASAPRQFDVLINAPAGTTQVGIDSPIYAGTVSFFGFMHGMTGDVTFTLPLPRNLQATNGALNVVVTPHVPSPSIANAAPQPARSVLKAVAVTAW